MKWAAEDCVHHQPATLPPADAGLHIDLYPLTQRSADASRWALCCRLLRKLKKGSLI